jgi:hypothetical protein
MSKQKLNHSRYMDFTSAAADRVYERLRRQPTARQMQFYRCLYAACKEHGIDAKTGHPHTRVGVSIAINALLERLNAAGVNIHGNGKTADHVLIVDEDKHGSDRARERIAVGDD